MRKILIALLMLLSGAVFAAEPNPELDLAMNKYLTLMNKKLYRYWNPPTRDSGYEIVVLIRLNKQGEVLHTTIVKSSGDETLDKAAFEAANKSKPFEPLPKEFTGKTVDCTFTLNYGYEVSQK
jgi:TonB family protein